MSHTYEMTPPILKRLETLNGPQVCEVCGEPIENGEKVVSRHARAQNLKSECLGLGVNPSKTAAYLIGGPK